MASRKQKKIEVNQDGTFVEGVSKKIIKKFEKIVQEFEESFKNSAEAKKQDYSRLCDTIEELAISADDCYKAFIGDSNSLTLSSRNPFLLLRYVQLLINSIVDIRREEVSLREQKKRENDAALESYNQNNIYELVAKKNIEFAEMETEISQLRNKLQLATQRAKVAEQIAENVKKVSEDMLKVYRDNFCKMSDFLKAAQQKETQLLQSNRLLNEEIQSINMEFEIYKKNFKKRTNSGEKEKRLKERLQKQYEEKVALVTKQIEYQLRHKPS